MSLTPVPPTTHIGEANAFDLFPTNPWERVDDNFDLLFPVLGYGPTYRFFVEDYIDFDYNDLYLECNWNIGCTLLDGYSALSHNVELIGNASAWHLEVYPINHLNLNNVPLIVSTLDNPDRVVTFGQPVPEIGSFELFITGMILVSVSQWFKRRLVKQ